MRSGNRGTKIRTALCVSCVFYVLLGTSHAEELRQLSPIRKTPTVKTLQMKPSAAAPSVKSVTPENPSVIPGGDPLTVTLSGSNLNLITSVQVMSNDEVVPDVTAEMGDPVSASREVTITAQGEALPGTYQVRLFAGSKAIDLDASVVSVVVGETPVQTPTSGVIAGKTTRSISPARDMETTDLLAQRSGAVADRSAERLPESKPSGTVMIDTVPLPEKPASGLPTSRLPDSKKVDTLKIDTVPLPERSTSGPMRTVPQPPTTGEGEKTQIQPLRAPMPPSDTSGAKKLVTTEAKPGLKYVETKEGIKPQPGISDRISPKQGSSTLSNRVGPAQLDEQKLPSGSAMKEEDFHILMTDLELIGVEVLVSNGEGFLPHRKIYADSDLMARAYFRNSGKTDLDQMSLAIKVSNETGKSIGYSLETISLRRGEEKRWFAGSFQLPDGINTLKVRIDSLNKSFNKIPESNEKNNEKSIRFEVLPTPAGGIPFADCGVHTLNAKFDVFPLEWHTRGDTDMHGNGPTVTIEGEMLSTGTRLVVWGGIFMSEGDSKENQGDNTGFEMPFINQIYKAPEGCRIMKVEFEPTYNYINPLVEYGYIQESLKGSKKWKTVHAARPGAGPQLFQSALCRGDTAGSETNKIGCKDIALKPLRVHLESVTGPVCSHRHISLPRRGRKGGLVGVYPLKHTRGDDEMGGSHSVKEQFNVALKSDRGLITTEQYARMEEIGGDRSTFEGSSSYPVFNTNLDAPGCYIRNIYPGGSVGMTGGKTSILKTDDVFRHTWHWIGDNGLLKGAWCRADTKGNDSGKLGCKEIEYAVKFIDVDLWPTQIQGPPLTSKAIPANLTTSLQLPSSAPMRTLERPIKPR